MIPSLSVLANFRVAGGGGGGGPVRITDRTISVSGPGSGSVTATYGLNPNGNVYDHNNNVLETWLISGANSDYEVMATGGPFSGGSGTGVWLSLSAIRSWSRSAGPLQHNLAGISVQIRLAAAPNTVLDTAAIELDADNGS